MKEPINWKDEKDALSVMAQIGMSLAAIAREYDVSRERMRQVFNELGLERSKNYRVDTQYRPKHYKKKLDKPT